MPGAEQTAADFIEWEDEINVRGEHLPRASYEHLGPISEVVPVRYPERVWTGAISVIKRRGEISIQDLANALRGRNLHRYYVNSSNEARTRCMDGRCICNYDTDESLQHRPLGPQVAGGTQTSGLCARASDTGPMEDDYDPTTDNDRITDHTFMQDIDNMRALLDSIMWKAGGHIDDHAPEGKTGCGAMDNIPKILERLTSPAAQMQLRGLAQRLLGDNYSEAMVNELLGRFLFIQGNAETYFAHDEKGSFTYPQDAIERLQTTDGVAKLMGPHNEVGLVINLIRNTTFHRDQFAVDSDHLMQLFGYDFWRSVELADKIPQLHHRDKPLSQEESKNLRDRFITSRLLFTIATAMVLTDGSIELIVRSGS